MPAADIRVHENKMVLVEMLDEIPVRSDVLFTNDKGETQAGVEKRTSKMVRNLCPALKRILRAEETVLHAMPARSPLSAPEQLTATLWTAMLTACAMVVTNQRILFFPVKRNGTWRESTRAVAWGDLQEVQPMGFLVKNVRFSTRDGAKFTFMNIRSADAKKLSAISKAFLPAAAGEQTSAPGMVQLCPDCCTVLTPGNYQCANCRLIFKNEKTMIARSIFLPGGGYFYTGHPLVAIPPAIVETILLVEVFVLLLARIASRNAAPQLWNNLLILGVFWALETGVTILHCRRFVREFIPVRRTPAGFPQSG